MMEMDLVESVPLQAEKEYLHRLKFPIMKSIT